MKYCKRCGCKLDKTNWDVYWCNNCGKLVENQEEREEEGSKDISYVG